MKTLTLSLFLLVLSAAVSGQSGSSKTSPAITKNMQAFLEATTLDGAADSLYNQMVTAFMRQSPPPGKRFLKRLKKKVSQEEVVKIMAPILANHFSDERLGDLARSIRAKEQPEYSEEMEAFLLESGPVMAKWAIELFDSMKEEYLRKQKSR
ncbi:hypothetical protein [Chitinophaga sp.]|uniref:hypothetical protein n=1 Tax=Chitinophaga sp. TaxID=1869181 RepID=UPI0026107D27|nr:hypothetical protein [uncultured Chitinophaga sp.]